MLDVTHALRPERASFIELLSSFDATAWGAPTECPAYSVQGLATHVLGDDLSLLSRQRDGAPPGVLLVAEDLPGADFRTLLDAFNDRWVDAARFFSPSLLIELLRWSGEQTAAFYESVDLAGRGPVRAHGCRRRGRGRAQAADLLTRAHTSDEIRALVRGPDDAVELAASTFGR